MRRGLVPVLGVLVAGALALPSQAAPAAPCAPGTAAVLHRAGGVAVSGRSTRAGCGSDTGFYTGETGIAVTPNGDVWFSAADWEHALVRSGDDGRTWQKVVPEGAQATPGCYAATSPFTCQDTESAYNATVADAFLWADPATGKVFWSKTYGLAICSSLSMTADGGRTWQATPRFACPGGDYEKIAGGPPPAGGAKPTGYPSVLYTCTNGVAPWFVVGPGRPCYASLDGGTNWNLAGMPLPSPLAPGCLHFQEPQVVSRHGTVYLPISCGSDNPAGLIRFAWSDDEARTWQYASVPTAKAGNGSGLIGGVSIAVDAAETVYVAWKGTDNEPYLAVTPDKGKTWRGPWMIAPKGVHMALVAPQVVAQRAGHVAVGYYGYRGSDSTRLNGYLTESFDGSSADPLFATAPVNDPRRPLYFPVGSGTLPRNDYLGVAMGPDGTPWIGLVRLLSTKPDSQGYVQSTGYAGRLVTR